MQAITKECVHAYVCVEKEHVTDFVCVRCGRVNVVSNNYAETFKRNNFIVIQKGTEG